jgi:hypothetical protein
MAKIYQSEGSREARACATFSLIPMPIIRAAYVGLASTFAALAACTVEHIQPMPPAPSLHALSGPVSWEGPIVDVCGPDSANVHPPAFGTRFEKSYPDELRQSGKQGWVVLQFVVTRTGFVPHDSVAVLDASSQDFVSLAIVAVTDHTYQPAQISGIPTRVVARQIVVFRLRKPSLLEQAYAPLLLPDQVPYSGIIVPALATSSAADRCK